MQLIGAVSVQSLGAHSPDRGSNSGATWTIHPPGMLIDWGTVSWLHGREGLLFAPLFDCTSQMFELFHYHRELDGRENETCDGDE